MGTQPRNHIAHPVGDFEQWASARFESQRPAAARSPSERDADRILYSSAFQRLAGITQVTSPDLAGGTHSRLTHTVKVAQLSRRLAQWLSATAPGGAAGALAAALDPEAAYTAGLVHDLGHPPFGHIAEQELDTFAARAGGFEGNAQSFRVVTHLAARTPQSDGLNLSRGVLAGAIKYPWGRSPDTDGEAAEKWGYYSSDQAAFLWARDQLDGDDRTLVAAVMDWADDVTYAVHDVDDFFRAGLIPLHHLSALDPKDVKAQPEIESLRLDDPNGVVDVLQGLLGYGGLRSPFSGTRAQRAALRAWGSWLIDRFMKAARLENDDSAPHGVVLAVEPSAIEEVEALKQLTKGYVIANPRLGAVQHGQRRIVRELAHCLYEAMSTDGDRRLLPPRWTDSVEAAKTEPQKVRLATDMVASLTEEGAARLHAALTGQSRQSMLPPTP